MKLQKKIVILINLCIIGIAILGGCSNKSITTNVKEQDNRLLKIGLISNTENCCTAPVDSEQGFQTELWYEIGKRSNYKVQFKSSDISELEKLQKSNEVKTIINKYDNSDSRSEKYTFTIPITNNTKVKVVQYAFNKDENDLVKSINSAIKSMQEDGTMEKLLLKWYK